MSSTRGLLIGVLTALTSGCVGSVHPAVPDSALTFEPQLLGSWTDSASRERAVIIQTGPRTYGIQYTDGKDTLSLVGLLGRNRERFVLDVQPTAEALGSYKDLVVRLHIPVILDSIGPRVHVAILEPDSIDQYLRTHPRAVAHARTPEGRSAERWAPGLVLTAASPELWHFLATYLQRPGTLSAASTWLRRSP